ncbi:hypothetical protein FCOIX_5626 [Fusarium coicis]|nr:hypothetical protein FCOIX_5626 [Fusarium coicis]
MGLKQEARTPEALSSATYTIGRHLDNIEMPQLGPIDAFMNDIWDHGHIDVASTQRNATLLVPVTIHTIAADADAGAGADADADAAGVFLMFHRASHHDVPRTRAGL